MYLLYFCVFLSLINALWRPCLYYSVPESPADSSSCICCTVPFYIPLGGHPSSSALRTSLNNLNLLVSSDRNNNSTTQSACTAAAVAAAAAANSQSRLQTPPNSLWIPSIPPGIEAGHPTRASYHGDNPSTSLFCNTGQSQTQSHQIPSAICTTDTVTASATSTASDAAVAAAAAQIDEDYDVLLDQVLLLKNPPLPTPTHYGVETDLREDIIDTLSPLEPSPMRHSPLFHSSGQSGISRPFNSSYIDHTTNPLLVPHFSSSSTASYGITASGLFTSGAGRSTSSGGRPPFTRSQSVPEQSTLPSAIDLIHDSEQEELLLEAAANTLDEPLPILGLNYPVLPPAATDFQRPLSRQSYLRSRAERLGAAPFSTSLPDSRGVPAVGPVFRSTTGTPFLTRPLSRQSRLSHSSELPTTANSAAVQDRLSLLYAEIEAASNASRRLTAGNGVRNARIPRIPIEPPLSIGRSLQLVTDAASARHAQLARAEQQLSNSLQRAKHNKSVRFNAEEWNRRHRHLLQDPSLFPSGLGIEEDAWMSVEDVQTGRWARWDALVKQESQDSQTRDSGIETGSCFTSSESGSATDHLHLNHHYYQSHQKKVWSLTKYCVYLVVTSNCICM